MAVRGAGNISVLYNAVELKNYINEAELASQVAELEATHLGSSAQMYAPGLASFTVSLKGDWVKALDDALGVDAMNPVMRALTVKFTDENNNWVQYAWTATGGNGAFITGYSISTNATAKTEHSPSLRASGIPTRTSG